MILYQSTRGAAPVLDFEAVLLTGLAKDQGLYVPQTWPKWEKNDLRRLQGLSYKELTLRILEPFLQKLIPPPILQNLIDKTYDNFHHSALVPLVQIDQRIWLLELFHGPTLSFKDLALQLVGQIFSYLTSHTPKHFTLLTATSGDTGSAAISAFQACKNMDIFVLYPKDRISPVQRRQMTTIQAPNVHTIALKGTFDDCQAVVKRLFNDPYLSKVSHLSAANSINWARIMVQTVYYFAAALAVGTPDRSVSFVVPTGNFGNIYAAYGCKCMGLPIDSLISASNENDSIPRFFQTGTMDYRAVVKTISPSIDIVIPSNFERFLFDLYDRNSVALNDAMQTLRHKKYFSVAPEILQKAQSLFTSYKIDQQATYTEIKNTYLHTNTLIDPHTAVGMAAARKTSASSKETDTPIITTACAHPAKFPEPVIHATGVTPPLPTRLADLYELPERTTVLPNDLDQVIRHIAHTLNHKTS